jgi:hypothetical protein
VDVRRQLVAKYRRLVDRVDDLGGGGPWPALLQAAEAGDELVLDAWQLPAAVRVAVGVNASDRVVVTGDEVAVLPPPAVSEPWR